MGANDKYIYIDIDINVYIYIYYFIFMRQADNYCSIIIIKKKHSHIFLINNYNNDKKIIKVINLFYFR